MGVRGPPRGVGYLVSQVLLTPLFQPLFFHLPGSTLNLFCQSICIGHQRTCVNGVLCVIVFFFLLLLSLLLLFDRITFTCTFLIIAAFPCCIRVFNTEYTSRYAQPVKFKYVDGLWLETPVNAGATYDVKVSQGNSNHMM